MRDDCKMKRKTPIRFAAVAAGIALAGPVAAQGLGDGIAALARRDYDKAETIFRGLAEDGNAEAAFRLGWMYASGHGRETDQAAARRWYARAAEEGHSKARARLTALRGRDESGKSGEGGKRNRLEALTAAAEAGAPRAMIRLGRAYAMGRNAAVDPQAARRWFERALAAAPKGRLAQYARNALAKLDAGEED